MTMQRRNVVWLILMVGLLLFPSGLCLAQVQEGGVVRFPTPVAERLEIRHPMGSLSVRGWDRKEVHISFRKQAENEAMLALLRVEVQVVNGRITIQSGVEVGGILRGLPQPSALIDLTIDAPRTSPLLASTFSGDLSARGFASDVDLDTSSGAIRVSEISGQVRTHTARGGQWIRSIQGAVNATGISGDVDVAYIDGPTLLAQVVRGQITAREIRTQVVEMQNTYGTLLLIGALQSGAVYDLHSEEGEVRLLVPKVGLRFTLEVMSKSFESPFRYQLRDVAQKGSYLRGTLAQGGPQLRLSAEHGLVSILPQPTRN